MAHVLGFILIILFVSCSEIETPKPNGYLRIDFPEKKYQKLNGNYPYIFKYPSYGKVVNDTSRTAEKYWINIDFPSFTGKIHISYKPVQDNLPALIDDSRKLAYKHTIKADEINEQLISVPANKVYGILYEIKGNTASSLQFFVTDSSNHFIRGALYFSSKPNKDSLAPVIDFFRADIDTLISSIKWDTKL